MSPFSKPTITSSFGCGSIITPRALPALGEAMRSHSLSRLSSSAGNFTLTRPIVSGSLLLVTIPITSASPNLLFAPLPPVRAAIELGVAVAVETKVSNAPPPRNVWRTVPTTYLPLNCWPTP